MARMRHVVRLELGVLDVEQDPEMTHVDCVRALDLLKSSGDG